MATVAFSQADEQIEGYSICPYLLRTTRTLPDTSTNIREAYEEVPLEQSHKIHLEEVIHVLHRGLVLNSTRETTPRARQVMMRT